MKYGIDSTWHQLQEDEDALKLVKEYLPEITSIIEVAPGAERISFRSLWSYVWLPVQMVDGMPRIFWKDHWKKEDML